MIKKNQIKILVLCATASICILISLYAFSPLSMDIDRGPFQRTIQPRSMVHFVASIDLRYNSFYLAGVVDSKVYLGNSTAPLLLVTATTSERIDTTNSLLRLKDMPNIDLKYFKLIVDSPNFFLSNGRAPEILRGDIRDWTAQRFMPDSGYYFVESVPLSSSSFAIKSYNTLQKGYELAKRQVKAPQLNFNFALLEKQIDGVFCVDGKLHYDRSTHKVVYLYTYRNEYVVADTNLNLIMRSHTIDTFSIARVKVSTVANGETMLKVPPLVVNGRSSIHKNRLYIQSPLLSNNERIEDFHDASIIDVYDIEKGKYLFSFYLPRFNEKRVKDFTVYSNKIIAIYDQHLVIYKMDRENRTITN